MARLELLRSEDDPRRFELGTVGTLTFAGNGLGLATAVAGEAEWSLARVGVTKLGKESRDASGQVVGTYEPSKWLKRELGRNRMTWEGRELWLRRSTRTGAEFEVLDGEQELFTIRTKRFSKTTKEMGTAWITDWELAPPGLVLFAIFAKFGEGKGS